jgi:hypothetical protein
MEYSDSNSANVPVDVQLTSTQIELLGLLRRLVHLIASDVMIDIRNLAEVRGSLPVRVGNGI